MRVLVLGVLALWAVFFIYGAAAAKCVDAFMQNIHLEHVSRLHRAAAS